MKLVVDHVDLARGSRKIVADLSFTLASGEALLITGPNGVGKTTLLRAIAGLFTPSAGSIALQGGAPDQTVGESCHFIGLNAGMKSPFSVADNLAFWARYLGGEGYEKRVALALARFHLEGLASIPFGYLSSGQKRRLGLARLLVAPRALWILDEPSVSLDAASTTLLSGVVSDHVAAGGMALIATHLPLDIMGARTLQITTPYENASESAS